jgi:hypothetical protein
LPPVQSPAVRTAAERSAAISLAYSFWSVTRCKGALHAMSRDSLSGYEQFGCETGNLFQIISLRSHIQDSFSLTISSIRRIPTWSVASHLCAAYGGRALSMALSFHPFPGSRNRISLSNWRSRLTNFSYCESFTSVTVKAPSKLREVAVDTVARSSRLRPIAYPPSLLERSGAAFARNARASLLSNADKEW